MRRRSQIEMGLLGLAGAGLSGWVARGWYGVMSERLALLHMGTWVYRRAQWASTISVAAFATAAASLAVWLLAFSLGRALGLETGARTQGRPALRALRFVLAAGALPSLLFWASDEFYARQTPSAAYQALGLAFVMWLLLGYDVPRLFASALKTLRSRAQLVRAPRRRLDALPQSGRVRTHGVIAADAAPSGTSDGCVYRHEIDPATGTSGPPLVQPFWLEASGARARVEAEGGRLLVAADERAPGRVVLRPGDAIDVIGEVVGGGPNVGSVYRESPTACIGAGGGVLVLLQGTHRMDRRLLLAAAIELLAAIGFVGCLAALAGLWIYVGVLAR
ncbi:MAG TPA: hypothetical protein VKN99_23130 [Polyangia bacterium]|nr:hypothetical protein [Polyangia bacterium]